MLSSSHNYHQSVTFNAARNISGTITKRLERGREYFKLRQINAQLVTENRQLRQRLQNLEAEREGSFSTFTDTITLQEYDYLDARVINNSTNRQKNFITLNRGRRHGVSTGMAVASPEGVVGVVVGVSQNFSIAMSLLNVDFRLSSSIARNNYFGSLAWKGSSFRYAQLSEIPHHVLISEGDTIVTSGYSAIFPSGVMVGTVTGEPEKGGDFITLKIKLSVDFKKLTNVYIIGNLHRVERIKLEEEVVSE